MSRVSAAAVKALGGWDVPDNEVTPLIEAASAEVTALGFPEENNKTLELYLAAHFMGLKYPAVSGEGAGSIRVTYDRGATGAGLASTKWGQEYRRLVRRLRKLNTPVMHVL